MKEQVQWLSETVCDFCHRPISGTLYDAKTKYGPWATMCSHCYEQHSVHKLGLGYGQKYQFDGKAWPKVDG